MEGDGEEPEVTPMVTQEFSGLDGIRKELAAIREEHATFRRGFFGRINAINNTLMRVASGLETLKRWESEESSSEDEGEYMNWAEETLVLAEEYKAHCLAKAALEEEAEKEAAKEKKAKRKGKGKATEKESGKAPEKEMETEMAPESGSEKETEREVEEGEIQMVEDEEIV